MCIDMRTGVCMGVDIGMGRRGYKRVHKGNNDIGHNYIGHNDI